MIVLPSSMTFATCSPPGHLVGRHHLQRRAAAPCRAVPVVQRRGELGAVAAEVPDGLVAEGVGTCAATRGTALYLGGFLSMGYPLVN